MILGDRISRLNVTSFYGLGKVFEKNWYDEKTRTIQIQKSS